MASEFTVLPGRVTLRDKSILTLMDLHNEIDRKEVFIGPYQAYSRGEKYGALKVTLEDLEFLREHPVLIPGEWRNYYLVALGGERHEEKPYPTYVFYPFLTCSKGEIEWEREFMSGHRFLCKSQ